MPDTRTQILAELSPGPELYISGGSRGHKNHVIDCVKGRVAAVHRAADGLVRCLSALEEAGVARSDRYEVALAGVEALQNAVGFCERDLAINDISPDAIFVADLSELRAALAELNT